MCPIKLLLTSPNDFFLSLYLSVFGLLISYSPPSQPSTTKPTTGHATSGLAYLSVAIASILFIARTNDVTIIRLTKANNNIYEPEMRLPICVFFGIPVPISFF